MPPSHLKTAAVVLARREDLRLEAAALGVALEHPRHLSGPERRLVAARGAPHLDEHVLLVERVLRRHRDAQLFLERRQPLLELGHELAEVRVAARSVEVGADRAPFLRELVRLLELLQLAGDLGRLPVVVVDGRVGHPLLRLRVGAVQLVDEALDRHRRSVALL